MIDANSKLESNKKELQLSINSFDNPTELSDLKAWSQLILELIFLEPGTFPSYPEMGVGIENYDFDFIDEAVTDLTSKITEQQTKYLKDVPLTAVTIEPATVQGVVVLLIQLTFTTPAGSANSAIAIKKSSTSRNYLDFEVSW